MQPIAVSSERAGARQVATAMMFSGAATGVRSDWLLLARYCLGGRRSRDRGNLGSLGARTCSEPQEPAHHRDRSMPETSPHSRSR